MEGDAGGGMEDVKGDMEEAGEGEKTCCCAFSGKSGLKRDGFGGRGGGKSLITGHVPLDRKTEISAVFV